MKHHALSFFALSILSLSIAACGGAPETNAAGTTEDALSTTEDATFEVDCVPTAFGQNVFVVGNIPELGSWDPKKAVPLEGQLGSLDVFGPRQFLYSWKADVKLQAGTTLEFKFILVDANGHVTWESGPNRTETLDGHPQSFTALSGSLSNTIYTYADYWNRSAGAQCTTFYNDYSNYLGQQKA